MACDANGVHEGASMRLFQYWVRDPVKAALTARTTTKLGKKKEGKVRTYCQYFNWFLATNAPDDVIAEKEQEMVRFSQPNNMGEIQYDQELLLRALKCGSVYREDRIVEFFIYGLHYYIYVNVRNQSANNPE